MAKIGIEEVEKVATTVWKAIPNTVERRAWVEPRAQAKWANDELTPLIQWLRQAQIDQKMQDTIIMRQTYLEAFRSKVRPATVQARWSRQAEALHNQVHDLVMMPLLEGRFDIEDALDILEFIVGYASGLQPVEVEHESS